MLTAITSLAILAHSATGPNPYFNYTLYGTAATVIPVLILALAVQGPAWTTLLESTGARHAGPIAAVVIAILITTFGVIGEILAPVSSLHNDQMKFLISPSGLGTGPRDSGPAWRKVVADLGPIASACHVPLSELESGLG